VKTGLEIRRFDDPRAFRRRAEAWLLEREAEHNLLLGLGRRLSDDPHAFGPPIYLATVELNGEVVGCAFRTPPYKLGLTRMPLAALPLLLEDVETVYPTIPAILGPDVVMGRLAELWGRRKGLRVRCGMRQGIYQLRCVRDPDPPAPGRLRTAGRADLDLVTGWARAFAEESRIQMERVRKTVEDKVVSGSIWLWEEGGPKSMAGVVALTPHGARIGYVYTPPEWRGQGFASACVAHLSRRVLDGGCAFCFLYTDLANPTSNAIYRKIGYEQVAEVVDYEIERPGGPA